VDQQHDQSSVDAEESDEVEIVVADDGSADGTVIDLTARRHGLHRDAEPQPLTKPAKSDDAAADPAGPAASDLFRPPPDETHHLAIPGTPNHNPADYPLGRAVARRRWWKRRRHHHR
jgi:glycosyltransferase involved in cell wall biosynthesis